MSDLSSRAIQVAARLRYSGRWLTQNVVKFQAINRLNSILVVSQRPEYLKRAATWIARLDKSDTDGVNLKAYSLRYGNAKQVTALLYDTSTGSHSANGTSLDNASSQISPGAGISVSSSSTNPVAALSAMPTAASGVSPAGAAPSLNIRAAPNAGGQDSPPGGLFAAGGKPAAGSAILQNVRITADVTNNAVLVYADQELQRIIEQTIHQIDRPQRQIAIEATIAEVTLNDQLNYGVQFFLASQKGSIANTVAPSPGSNVIAPADQTESSVASAVVNSAAGNLLGRALPGFNFLIAPRIRRASSLMCCTTSPTSRCSPTRRWSYWTTRRRPCRSAIRCRSRPVPRPC